MSDTIGDVKVRYMELYDRYSDLKDRHNELKTQIKEANRLIDYCLTETVMHSYDKDKLREYKARFNDVDNEIR